MSFLKQLLATPRNPYIPNWDKIDPMEVEFSGCKLRLDLPPGSDPDFKDEIHTPFDIYNDFYEDNSYLKWYSQDNFLGKRLIRRSFRLLEKPWRKFDLGTIDITVFIYKVTDLPSSMSCLIPNHFLQVLDKFQFFTFGPNRLCNVGNSYYSTYNNWKVVAQNKINWLFFETIENRGTINIIVPSNSSFFTPIDKEHFLKIGMTLTGSYEPIDDCLISYNNIIKKLASKISLSLSPFLERKHVTELQNNGSNYPSQRDQLYWESFYIPGWHEDISRKEGEPLLVHPIPQYKPNV